MSGTRVTATAVDTGETQTAVISNDYVVICDGTARISSITRHGNGTTNERIKNQARADDVALPVHMKRDFGATR